MTNIIILDVEKEISVAEEVDRELLWYDHKKKKMLKFQGGQLFFEYKFDDELKEYRLLPKVSSLSIQKKKRIKSREAILDWLHVYSIYHDTDIEKIGEQDNGILFSVPDNEVEDICYDLERQGIEYRVE